jgi:hypothetical protein
MCRIARRRIEDEGLQEQVHILRADARQLGGYLPVRVRSQVQLVVAASLLNEFCYGGVTELIRFLVILSKAFPGRLLLVDDYYGVIPAKRIDCDRYAHSLVHDIAQLATGQGIPPRNRQTWLRAYASARCRLVRRYEGFAAGFNWFIHVIRLPSQPLGRVRAARG